MLFTVSMNSEAETDSFVLWFLTMIVQVFWQEVCLHNKKGNKKLWSISLHDPRCNRKKVKVRLSNSEKVLNVKRWNHERSELQKNTGCKLVKETETVVKMPLNSPEWTWENWVLSILSTLRAMGVLIQNRYNWHMERLYGTRIRPASNSIFGFRLPDVGGLVSWVSTFAENYTNSCDCTNLPAYWTVKHMLRRLLP